MTEQEEGETAMEEEQLEGLDPAYDDDENETIQTEAPAQETKKGKEKKGKGAGRPKKSSEKSKEPPSKKRKRSEDLGNKENQKDSQAKMENGSEDVKHGKGSGSGRKKGDSSETWTPEVDKVLVDAIKKHTNNNIEAMVPWKETYKDFKEAFPDSQRTIKALQMRWCNHLKHGEVDLTEEQVCKSSR